MVEVLTRPKHIGVWLSGGTSISQLHLSWVQILVRADIFSFLNSTRTHTVLCSYFLVWIWEWLVIFLVRMLSLNNVHKNSLWDLWGLRLGDCLSFFNRELGFHVDVPQVLLLVSGLCKMSRLRRLYINENELDFQGIPPGMGKLGAMEIFSAADNQVQFWIKP